MPRKTANEIAEAILNNLVKDTPAAKAYLETLTEDELDKMWERWCDIIMKHLRRCCDSRQKS
jgi:hypothetical protein